MSSILEFRSKLAAAYSSSTTPDDSWESLNAKLFKQRGFYFRLANPEFGNRYKWCHAKDPDAFARLVTSQENDTEVFDFSCKVFYKDKDLDLDFVQPKKIYELTPKNLFPRNEFYNLQENLKWIYVPQNFEGELNFQLVFDERGLKDLFSTKRMADNDSISRLRERFYF